LILSAPKRNPTCSLVDTTFARKTASSLKGRNALAVGKSVNMEHTIEN